MLPILMPRSEEEDDMPGWKADPGTMGRIGAIPTSGLLVTVNWNVGYKLHEAAFCFSWSAPYSILHANQQTQENFQLPI